MMTRQIGVAHGFVALATLGQCWLALLPLERIIDWSSAWYLCALASWNVFWILRWSKSDPSSWSDLLFSIIRHLMNLRDASFSPIDAGYLGRLTSLIRSFLLILVPVWFFQGNLSSWLLYRGDQGTLEAGKKSTGPLLYPSRTTHSRTFPEKHSFVYDYLVAAIPVGWHGCSGSLISTYGPDSSGRSRKEGWFNVKPQTYLERGGAQKDLESKLRKYLQSQGVADHEWSRAFLVTAPRLLGYSFNPASFWYIYDAENELRMMLIEVNNTFDEKRMYLLKARSREAQDIADVTPELGRVERSDASTKVFTAAWSKDFHVSPFNSRKGSYSVAARDPMLPDGTFAGTISTTIVLRSSKGRTKLIARIFSQGSPLDPSTASRSTQLAFLLRWCSVGFLTFPRILIQAYKLYFTRNLHVWFRPEVLPESIGRSPTEAEILLQRYFEGYLTQAVRQAEFPIVVTYDAGISTKDSSVLTNLNENKDNATTKYLKLRVLSPAFYSRFVHYAHAQEAFDRECLLAGDKNRTVWASDPKLLAALIPALQNISVGKVAFIPGFFNRTRWCILQLLRCPPAAVSYPLTEVMSLPSKGEDIRRLPHSPLDRYVLSQPDSWIYRRTVTQLFIAQRFALGMPGIIGLTDFLARFGFMLLVRNASKPWKLSNTESSSTSAFFQIWAGFLKVIVFNGQHLWSWIKGL